MSNERPEDRWKREKEYQPPTSDQGDQTVIDAFWMAEKRRQVPGQQNTGGQQYTGGQPNNQQYDQPVEIKTELFDWMDENRGQVPGQQGQQYTGGQPNNQQYDQPIEIKTELFDQPVEIKTELFDWTDENRGSGQQGGQQYGQPQNNSGNQDQWMAEKRGPVPGQQNTGGQQNYYGQQNTGGQPNNQPVEIKTELFDWMAEKRRQVPGQQGQQYTGGQPNNQQYDQPVEIKTELFDWTDENRGQVPGQGAGHGGNQYGQQGQPNGQKQWMAEKRGPVPGQQNPNGGQPGRQGGQPNGQEQWMAEKRGGPTPGQNGQQFTGGQQYRQQSGQPSGAQWMAEKRGEPVPGQNGQANQYRPSGQVGPAADPNQWMREKQGGPVPFAAQSSAVEAAWHQEKNFKAPSSGGNRNLYFILGGVGALVVIAIVVVVILLLQPKTPPVPAATATAAITTAAVTTSSATTAAVTTAAVTTSPANDSAKLLTLAQDATNKQNWQDVVSTLELLSPSDPNFSKAKPLLVNAYVKLGEQAVADKSNSQESANLALTNFRKANALDASFAGLAAELQQADTFATGLLQFNSEQYQQAVNTIKPLYDSSATQVDGVHYRNTGDILYNSYLKLGDKVFNPGNVDALNQARNFYSLALAVDVDNKDDAKKKLLQVTNALKLMGPTPTTKK